MPMSNCINSGINKVYILTQFNSASLNRHLTRAYNFGGSASFGDGYVEVKRLNYNPFDPSTFSTHTHTRNARFLVKLELSILILQALAATQTPGEAGKNWFQGTADAVRQFHWLFEVSISGSVRQMC